MVIRLIRDGDYKKVADMIGRSLKGSQFAKFYPNCSIGYVMESLDERGIEKRASWTHFYVMEDGDDIVACGAIGPYYDSPTESSLFNIFVDSAHQGKGYGRKIIETLESDEFFTRAERVEVSASMSAIPFYRKMGYEHKNGQLIYDDGHFALEKFNKK